MHRLLALALLALTAAGLGGCGNKGALVLPPVHPASATSVSPPTPAPAPADTAATPASTL